MKNTITLILILQLTFVIQMKAQNGKSVTTVNKKCVAGSFEYDKKFQWKEIDCSKIEGGKTRKRTNPQIIKKEQDRIKFLKYQEKLITLGYELEVNGLLDEKTITAHNTYLKRKEREEKRKRKKDKNTTQE